MITIRSPHQADAAFVISSWLSSHQEHWKPFVTAPTFNRSYRPFVEKCLSTSTILIAALEDEPDTILGYIVFKDNVIHYIYVKYPLRRQGLARKLITEAEDRSGVSFTKATHYPLWLPKKDDAFKSIYEIDYFEFFN